MCVPLTSVTPDCAGQLGCYTPCWFSARLYLNAEFTASFGWLHALPRILSPYFPGKDGWDRGWCLAVGSRGGVPRHGIAEWQGVHVCSLAASVDLFSKCLHDSHEKRVRVLVSPHSHHCLVSLGF